MPTGGNGVAIANGAAQGVDSFIKSFIQVSQMKNQQKLQKNAHIEDVLMEQIRDPNTKFYQRAKLIDAVGNLYDHPSLSTTLGYNKLNEEDVADPNQPAVQDQLPIAGTSATNLLDTSQTGATPDVINPQVGVIGQSQGLTKRGNLTPNDVAFQQRKSLQAASDESDIKKAERIARINFDLQEKSYKANGYKITSEGTDKSGNYVQILTNNSGDTKTNVLPAGFKPLKLSIAETSANKPSATLANLEQGYLNKTNQATGQLYTESEANAAAAKDFATHYQASTDYLSGKTTQVTNVNAGKTPISPSQTADDVRADKQNQLALQKSYDDAYSNAIKSSAEAKQFADEAHNHYLNIVTPAKDALDTWLTQNGKEKADTTDSDFIKLNGAYKAAVNQYNSLKSKADAAASVDAGNKKALDAASKRLGNSGNNTLTKKVSSNITPRMKAMIAAVRNDPKNKDAANMTDDEIDAQIIASGRK